MQVVAKLESVEVVIEGDSPLEKATKHPITESLLREQLGRLGGTAFELRNLSATIEGNPMIAFSRLGVIRKQLVENLDRSLLRDRRERSLRTGS